LDLGDRLPELTGACYCIASADGEISETEIKCIAESIAIFSSNAVDAAATEQLIARARNEVMSMGREAYIRSLGSRIPTKDGKSQLLGVAASTMFADRKVEEVERATFFAIASAIGVDETEADFILRSVEAPLR
jgi:uncharacterized tellurite resistance protein B-like protein